jgi:RNA polymerase sigma-70 factor (ECF subfamily)
LFGDLPRGIHPTVAPVEARPLEVEVAAAVSRLSPKLRLAVLLRYFDDLSYDEIARALDCSPGTVASRLARAHAALASSLAHLNSGHPRATDA